MRIKCTFILLLLLMAVGKQQARADLLFSLNPAALSGLPGDTLTFNATLTNTGIDPVYLNGDIAGVSASGLSLDDRSFFNNFPLFLLSGDAVTSDLFTVSIDPSVLSGDYTGTFTIVGGADAFAQDSLAQQNFLVSVTTVPETGWTCLLGSAIMFSAGLLNRRKARLLVARSNKNSAC